MNSTLEQQRMILSEIERAVSRNVFELQHKQRTPKTIVLQNHRINANLIEIAKRSEDLIRMFEDKDGFHAQEMREMQCDTLQKTMHAFDERLRALQEYHSNRAVPVEETHEASSAIPTSDTITAAEEQQIEELKMVEELRRRQPQVPFSGEEGYGRYVDLHAFYTEFINMMRHADSSLLEDDMTEEQKGGTGKSSGETLGTMDYVDFLDQFHHFHKIPVSEKEKPQYMSYLDRLYHYLLDFQHRSQPLVDISGVLDKSEHEFEQRWERGDIPGWKSRNSSAIQGHENGTSGSATAMDIENGEEQHQQDQQKRRRRRRRRRRRGAKGVQNVEGADAHLNRAGTSVEPGLKGVARLEHRIMRLAEILDEIIEATKINIEKRQTRTWEELRAEMLQEEEEDFMSLDTDRGQEDEEDEDLIASNPLNLPIGWDGKPIPYWLYKLHGLGIEYYCEICTRSYWGPRAFEKHFQEWRHAYGMRCLKIPNTRHFHHVTRIKDAIELWEKLQKQANTTSWKSDLEEFEDDEGTVMNRKLYEDLKRQGLL